MFLWKTLNVSKFAWGSCLHSGSKEKKETPWTHGRRKDTALWQLNEHNGALVETLAPQIDAHKEQERAYNGKLGPFAGQHVTLCYYL